MDHSNNYEFLPITSSAELCVGSVFCGTNTDGSPIDPKFTVEYMNNDVILARENSIKPKRRGPWNRVLFDDIAATGIILVNKNKTEI